MIVGSTTTGRVGTRILVLVSVALLAGGSACDPRSDETGTSDPTVAPTSTTTTPPSTSSSSTTTTTTVPVDLLASCVEHAKFQAFTGNQFWASIWDDAGRTDAGMRGACEFLASGQPGWLEEVHADWQEIQGLASSASTTTSTPTSTSTSTSTSVGP